jgi:hypothetical protein
MLKIHMDHNLSCNLNKCIAHYFRDTKLYSGYTSKESTRSQKASIGALPKHRAVVLWRKEKREVNFLYRMTKEKIYMSEALSPKCNQGNKILLTAYETDESAEALWLILKLFQLKKLK